MSRQQGVLEHRVPSAASILKATVVALIAAAIVLVVAVMPAEYGVDPLGAGKALGLLDLSKAAEIGTAAPVKVGVFTPQNRIYKVDAEDFGLHPGRALNSNTACRRARRWSIRGRPMGIFTQSPLKCRPYVDLTP